MTAILGVISAIFGAFISSVLAERKDKNKAYEKMFQCLFFLRLDKKINSLTLERLKENAFEFSQGNAFAKMYASNEAREKFLYIQNLIFQKSEISECVLEQEIGKLEDLIRKEITPWYKRVKVWGIVAVIFFIFLLLTETDFCLVVF